MNVTLTARFGKPPGGPKKITLFFLSLKSQEGTRIILYLQLLLHISANLTDTDTYIHHTDMDANYPV